MDFNVVHMLPSEKMHPLHGYSEVIETVMWGLTELGHRVTYTRNKVDPSKRSIIFGAQVISADYHSQLRPDTIVYNLEQFRNAHAANMFDNTKSLAARFELWDYSPFNVDAWNELELRVPVKVVPIGYAPLLERIQRPPVQEIDALFYGSTNDLRLSAFDGLASAWLKTVFLSGIYGSTRDALIARSRTVINMSLFTNSKIFEVVRVSFLLANRKAVISVLDPDTVIEDDLRPAIAATTTENLVQAVERLVADEPARRTLEERGYEIFRRRDVRKYLAAALG